jgi:hypothetical protein
MFCSALAVGVGLSVDRKATHVCGFGGGVLSRVYVLERGFMMPGQALWTERVADAGIAD